MISIIIPVFNEERLLPQLLGQFTKGIIDAYGLEIIVSDGGSTDGTCDIVLHHGHTLVRHSGPGRQTIAGGRNDGASAAHGEILVFLNGDVRIDAPDRFFSQIPSALDRHGVVAATCEVQVFPEEERISDRVFHILHNRYVRFLNAIGEGMGRGECQILLRTVFEREGGYNASMAAGEDYDLFRRIRKHGKIIMLDGVTVHESPRRFRKYGYIYIILQWTKNALSVAYRKKSSSTSWEAVR